MSFSLNNVFLYNNQKQKKGFLMTEQFIPTKRSTNSAYVRHWPCPSPKAVVQLIHAAWQSISNVMMNLLVFKSIRIYRNWS